MLRRLATGFCLWLFCSVSAMAAGAATVVFFSGQPQLIAADGGSRPLVRGAEVLAGETIDTADGRVQLRYRDGATMSLQPATRFRIDRFQYSGDRVVAGDGVVMTLIKGGLRTVTGWLGRKDRSQYRIGTSVATIGIRGTEFGALLDESGLLVTTYSGLVEVCSDVGCRDVAPSETVWVRAAGARPELRDQAPGRTPAGTGVIPETPIVREVQPVQGGQHSPNQAPPQGPTPYYDSQRYRP